MLAVLYGMVGALHWMARRPLLEISFNPGAAVERGRWVRWWDFLFYASFGLVVTSSVQLAGVLLVFSYLIVPAAVAALLSQSVTKRLALGWTVGFIVSVVGLFASAAFDLPTGATVVTTFGVLMAGVAAWLGLFSTIRGLRSQGLSAFTGPGIATFVILGLAGFLLVIFPRMDHHWLNWLERAMPPVQLAFLTSDERETYWHSQEAVERGLSELQHLRAMQQEILWGTREMSEERQERLRQYLAGRSEITAGDQMTLTYLRTKARERQRLSLGLPLFGIGLLGAIALIRLRNRTTRGVRSQGQACVNHRER